MRSVSRIFSAALVLAIAPCGPSFSQSGTDLSAVSGACSAGGDSCSSATSEYLKTLRAQETAGEKYNQQVADLVVFLATTAQNNGACDGRDKNLAQAISVSARFASAGQRAQINDIAAAVSACDEIKTAALSEPTSEGQSSPSGNARSASAN